MAMQWRSMILTRALRISDISTTIFCIGDFETSLLGHHSLKSSSSILGKLKSPSPPLEEQRRIAAILDKATKLEVLSMKQSSLLEDAEKHLFVEYFGSPFPGKTPWPVALLGELGSLERGISKHRPRNDPSLMDGPYPFIQTGDVAGCRGRITTFSATYSEKGLAQSRLWPAGTLCITIAANIAKTGILDFDACFPDSVVGFQDGNPAIITYVQCWMSFLQGHIEQMAPESAQKNINLEILRGLSVPVPSEDRMEEFHAAILLLRRIWSSLDNRRTRTVELKSSLQSAFFAA
jgi:type I restriction enzyme S subunit